MCQHGPCYGHEGLDHRKWREGVVGSLFMTAGSLFVGTVYLFTNMLSAIVVHHQTRRNINYHSVVFVMHNLKPQSFWFILGI